MTQPACRADPTATPAAATQDRNLWFWVFVGPFVLGLLVFVYVPIALEHLPRFFDARNTVTPTKFVGLGNYADMLPDPAFRISMLTFIVFAAFIVPTTFALSLGAGAAGPPRPVVPAVLPVGVLPADRVLVRRRVAGLEDVDLQRGPVRAGQHGARLVRHRRRSPWLAVTQPPWYWLVIVTVRLWLQVGFYMILFLAGLQRISPDALRGGGHRRRRGAGRCFRYITLPQLRGDLDGGAAAPARSTRSRRSTSSTTSSRPCGTYPPYARPPLVYLYYTALG